MSEIDEKAVEKAIEWFYDADFWFEVLNASDKDRVYAISSLIHQVIPEGTKGADVLAALYRTTILAITELIVKYLKKEGEE